MTLQIEREHTGISDSAVQNFKTHLETRIATLRNRVPKLFLETPTPQSNMRDFVLKTFYPANTTYKNREAQCDFVQRLLSETKGSVLAKLQQLTRNGDFCISGDLPPEQRMNWIAQWLNLLWNDKWLVLPNGTFSLEDLIVSKIGNENYNRPDILIARNEGFDGYGAATSRSLQSLIERDPLLQRFKNLGLQFNPDKPAEFTALGPEVQRAMTEENPYSMAGLVRTRPEIYISPVWPVAELAELLVHEYGHVLHGEQNPGAYWDAESKVLHRKSNGVHNEGVAEAFAEMVLADVFKKHPETEIFHLAKLRIFAEIRPQDDHLAGAAALASIFFQGSQDFSELLSLARAPDFLSYLAARGISAVKAGPNSHRSIPVYLQK